ncbi:MAG: hypothetical protein EOP04_20610 [Proteobacteria bacterium]|nr:MAG: hypothetical protein EOP04_20610 [Pseudomonadota bacterium]
MNDNLNNFLLDLVTILKEMAEIDIGSKENADDFDKGRRFGIYEALSLVHQQALVFDLDLNAIGLKNFDSDNAL